MLLQHLEEGVAQRAEGHKMEGGPACEHTSIKTVRKPGSTDVVGKRRREIVRERESDQKQRQRVSGRTTVKVKRKSACGSTCARYAHTREKSSLGTILEAVRTLSSRSLASCAHAFDRCTVNKETYEQTNKQTHTQTF